MGSINPSWSKGILAMEWFDERSRAIAPRKRVGWLKRCPGSVRRSMNPLGMRLDDTWEGKAGRLGAANVGAKGKMEDRVCPRNGTDWFPAGWRLQF